MIDQEMLDGEVADEFQQRAAMSLYERGYMISSSFSHTCRNELPDLIVVTVREVLKLQVAGERSFCRGEYCDLGRVKPQVSGLTFVCCCEQAGHVGPPYSSPVRWLTHGLL